MGTTTIMSTISDTGAGAMIAERQGLLRLASWLSPAFPVGAYSFSHGIEFALEAGLVTDRDSLIDWVAALLSEGAGRNDGLLFAAAWRAAAESAPGFDAELIAVAELAAALRGSRELAEETAVQGHAFLSTVRAAWPHRQIDAFAAALAEARIAPALPVAVGVSAAAHAIELAPALALYLQSFAANLVNAGVRLVPLGQTDGQRAVAALEETVLVVARQALAGDLDDIGSATPMADWTSLCHETQYTRLFRS